MKPSKPQQQLFSHSDKPSLSLTLLVCSFFCLSLLPAISMATAILIKDINPGENSSQIVDMSASSKSLFFAAQDENGIRQVWYSNGSDKTLQMTNVDPNIRVVWSSSNHLATRGFYFFQTRRKHDGVFELWRSNGTAAGTSKLIDLPDYLDTRYHSATLNGLYFFVPFSDPDYGRELWVSDATDSGTYLLKDISPGTSSSSPHDLVVVGNMLYFLSGNNLWASDGTANGTLLVANFDEGSTKDIRTINVVEDMIFISYLTNGSYELWRHDTKSGQTLKVKDFDGIGQYSSYYTAMSGKLYFTAKGLGAKGYDLWESDGTATGTKKVKDFSQTIMSSAPNKLTNVNGKLFFTAKNEQYGLELWYSNGTDAGTYMVKDISEGTKNSDLYCFTAYEDKLFFAQKANSYQTYLWQSDGSESATANTQIFVNELKCPVLMNGQLYFYGRPIADDSYGAELFSYNNSATTPIAPALNTQVSGNRLILNWSAVPNAEAYTLYYAAFPYAPGDTIYAMEQGNKTSFQIDLWPGASFYVAVKAYQFGLFSEYSNIDLFTIK